MSDLADRMLTCAAYIQAHAEANHVTRDAAELLKLGAEALNAQEPLPGLHELFRDPVFNPPRARSSKNACPRCGSRAHKKVLRAGCEMVAQCPACGTQWNVLTGDAR